MGQIRKSTRAFLSPAKYIQGFGEFERLESYTQNFGENAFALIDGFLFPSLSKLLEDNFQTIQVTPAKFEGQVSLVNTDRYTQQAATGGYDVIIGIGGGRTLDTAKVVANSLKLPLVIVPTSASTDAPTSALSVIYSEQGEHINEIFYEKGPDLVLIDSQMIAKAPIRLLVAGMGDALATFFEARACRNADSFTNVKGGYKGTITSYAIAKECYQVLLRDGLQAKLAAERGACTEAVENIIEVNSLLSGIGAESNGASGAHAFHDGMTALEECHAFYHGEKVAFGVICQLVLENRDMEEIEEVVNFSIQVGLPVCLREIGVKEITEDKIRRAAKAILASPLILREPFDVTEDMIYSAILAADAIGERYLSQNQK